ncbi:MAG TPA: hypothetical protein VF035_02110 [Longimicrobiales bacterium]
MPALAERAWFGICLLAGTLLRSARYARTEVVSCDGERVVHKQRRFYAPVLIGLGNPLGRLLGTGVRVLPQRQWAKRERELMDALYGARVHWENNQSMTLPFLRGITLAALLESADTAESERRRGILMATAALAHLHGSGYTHADAMAENVMIDLDGGAARWFDFETVHDPSRPVDWRRADDLRALIATCMLRTKATDRGSVLRDILDAYPYSGPVEYVMNAFATALQRSLPLHLGQAPLPLDTFREIHSLLRDRS